MKSLIKGFQPINFFKITSLLLSRLSTFLLNGTSFFLKQSKTIQCSRKGFGTTSILPPTLKLNAEIHITASIQNYIKCFFQRK